MVEQGMTHQQIADEVSAQSGIDVQRSAVSAALHRAGKTTTNPHYKDMIPWRIPESHQADYPLRMLRLLGRRRRNLKVSEYDSDRLDSWLASMERDNLVVACAPHTNSVVIYVEADEPTDKPDGIPIRPRTIKQWELDPDV